jgi:hypothetical protein
MSQGTGHQAGPGSDGRDGGAVHDGRPPQRYGPGPTTGPGHAPHPRGPQPMRPYPVPPPPGMPRQGPPGYGHPGHQLPTGGWAPIDEDAYDREDPRTPGNPAAATSVVLGALALLVGLRPLAFGSMALGWDGFVGIALALGGLVAGAVGLRTALRRPVAGLGLALAVVALLVVAVLPTF